MHELDSAFDRFEADFSPTVLPPGVAAVHDRALQRRRRRRLSVAAVIAVLLAVPVGATAWNQARPLPQPGDSPSPTFSRNGVETRHVNLAGVESQLRSTQFLNADVGWVYFDACWDDNQQATGCKPALAATTDGGFTWSRVPLPELSPQLAASFYAVDRLHWVVSQSPAGGAGVTSRWLSMDFGATWHRYEDSDPLVPVEIDKVKYPSIHMESELRAICVVGSDLACSESRVIRLGGPDLTSQPPLPGRFADTFTTGDGRIWASSFEKTGTDRNGNETFRTHAAVSSDNTATWTTLPPVSGQASLIVSASGKQAWIFGDDSLFHLEGQQWVSRSFRPGDAFTSVAFDDGTLVLGGEGGVDYFTPSASGQGNFDRVSGLPGGIYPWLLDDGTLAAQGNGGYFLGIGKGFDRRWIRITS